MTDTLQLTAWKLNQGDIYFDGSINGLRCNSNTDGAEVCAVKFTEALGRISNITARADGSIVTLTRKRCDSSDPWATVSIAGFGLLIVAVMVIAFLRGR